MLNWLALLSIIGSTVSVLFSPLPAAAATTRGVEQQIEIMDQLYTPPATSSYNPTDNSLGLIHWDASAYTNPTVYFEADGVSGISNALGAELFDEGGTEVAGSQLNIVRGRYRSDALSLVSGTNYTVRASNGATGNGTLRAARLIVVQNSTDLVRTETQIEVGDFFANSGAAFVPNPKFFHYDASKFDGSLSVSFSATLETAPGINAQAQAHLVDTTGSFDIAEADVTSTTSYSLGAVSILPSSLIDGHEYTVRIDNGGGGAITSSIANAKIVIASVGFSKFQTKFQMDTAPRSRNTLPYNTFRDFNAYEPGNFAGSVVSGAFEATLEVAGPGGSGSAAIPEATRNTINGPASNSGNGNISVKYDAGKPRIAFIQNENLIYAQCDSSCSSGASWSFYSVDNPVEAVSLDLDTGLPRLIYDKADSGDIHYAECSTAPCNSGADWQTVVLGNGGIQGVSPQSLFLDCTGGCKPRAAYASSGVLIFNSCNAACTILGNWTAETINPLVGSETYPQLAIDGGTPKITYISVGAGCIGVAFNPCFGVFSYAERVGGLGGTGCGGLAWSCLNIGDASEQAWATSLNDIGGQIQAAYEGSGATESGLIFANCSGGCTTFADWTLVSVDPVSTNLLNSQTSITNHLGEPRISYRDKDSGDLRYASCDANCNTAGNWGTVNVDSTGTVGDFSALDFDSGTPQFFYSGEKGALKSASCTGEYCEGSVITTTSSSYERRQAAISSLDDFSYDTMIRSEFGTAATVSGSDLLLSISLPPPGPTNFAGSALSTSSIHWTWTDNATTETGYRVRAASASSGSLSGDLPANTTSWNETGLSPNQQVARKAVAFNAAGESDASNSASVYTLAAGPTNPTSVGGHGTTDGYFIDVSWSAPAPGTYRGFLVNRYQNATCSGIGTALFTPINPVSGTAFRDRDLLAATTYCYKITSYNDDEVLSPASAVQTSATTPSDTVAPASSVTSPANGSFVASVPQIKGSASDDLGGVGVEKVEVSIKRVSDGLYWNGSDWQAGEFFMATSCSAACSSGDATVTFTKTNSLPPWESGVSYTVRSRATDRNGNVETPGSGNTFYFDSQPPTAPGLVSPENNSQTVLAGDTTFVWQAASDGQSGIDHYEFWIDGAHVADTTATTITRSVGLGLHTWFVRAFDRAGNHNDSQTWSFTLTSSMIPVKILEFKITDITDGSLTLTWRTNIPARALVTYSDGKVSSSIAIGEYSDMHTLTLTGLKPNTAYTITIEAITPDSTDSATQTATTAAAGRAGGIPGLTEGGGTAATAIAAGIAAATSFLWLSTPWQVVADLLISLWAYIYYLVLALVRLFAKKSPAEPWGVIYDAASKKPLPYTFVTLFGNTVQRTVTDKQGRYGFYAPAGQYEIRVDKPGYRFASKSLIGDHDAFYKDLYFGERFEVKDSGLVKYNIPLDPAYLTNRVPNIASPAFIREQLAKVSLVASILGVAIAAYIYSVYHSPWHLALGALSVLFTVSDLKHFAIRNKMKLPLGHVMGVDLAPIAGVTVKLMSSKGELIEIKSTDDKGQYAFFAWPGSYLLIAEKEGYIFKPAEVTVANKDNPYVGKVIIGQHLIKDEHRVARAIDISRRAEVHPPSIYPATNLGEVDLAELTPAERQKRRQEILAALAKQKTPSPTPLKPIDSLQAPLAAKPQPTASQPPQATPKSTPATTPVGESYGAESEWLHDIAEQIKKSGGSGVKPA